MSCRSTSVASTVPRRWRALQPVRLTDAVHLAAADAAPAPVSFVTFDPAQIGVALGMGFDVVSS